MNNDIPGYETPGCAYCPSTVRACRQGEGEERGPAFCPSKVDPEGVAAAWEPYRDPFTLRVAHTAAVVESEGYCKWTRVEEICQFAKKMGFTRVGIAIERHAWPRRARRWLAPKSGLAWRGRSTTRWRRG